MDEVVLEPGYVRAFQDALLSWGRENFRSFPWRETRDPYRLLIAETLLHRTQAKQVVEVYMRFVKRFPTVEALHQAQEGEIQEVVKSLGLFWRSALIQDLAKTLMVRFRGEVPPEQEALLSLPGVGDYIASSVRCFAFGLPDAIVDTNVMRVITRVLGIPFRDSLRRNRKFQKICQELVSLDNPREYNFAVLDLAGMVCIPGIPRCSRCPVRDFCSYYQTSNAEKTLIS